ncbi:ATP-binding cassette domain-containing protein [Shimia ponticola]|uniref:ATP-binding cassette domain-containing protein n=1 Tax=Shimia ponticola TaxID=2582893 RepID=UPI0021023D01|nr:ATP-binding cassette domain-containing protein [Shimia ponticola]
MKLTVSGLRAVLSGQTILHPTSLSIATGDRIGLVGSSGSGKSTLCHALIDDLRARGHSVSHGPQSPDEALDPLRSMALHWREAERASGVADVDRAALFSALGIESGDMRKRPWGWSRGMQQCVVMAMALIGTPDLIALDEPTSALAPVGRGSLYGFARPAFARAQYGDDVNHSRPRPCRAAGHKADGDVRR